ncbi:zonadhesin-like isoform X2 [Pectinophora gossypiella]|uniref:zonadhesin-like isoform X2 n=1 Tax=Pectinophora gossypiella TaxID=13191 RepID=UPI00214E2C2F|nr:zonadhesin-like isoform X2 [Pectinophora gossypiella]
MEPIGCLSVCLLVCVTVAYGVLGANEGHGSLCRANERFLSCGGCQKSCRDPAPDCAGVCRAGCFCNDGEVRNDTGHCVQLHECPPVAPSSLLSTEPRVSGSECPADEEYRSCEPCNRTCDNPNPICPAQCARGCFCRDDLVRDKDGRCVKIENCSHVKRNDSSNKTPQYQLTCGPHQVYSSCRSCEKTCSSPIPECSQPCSAGCFCEDGYLKAPSGKCVKLEECPRDKCQDPDEEFVCRYGCEARCDTLKCRSRPRRCVLGCHCRLGLLRDVNGKCVAPNNCQDPANTTTIDTNTANNASEITEAPAIIIERKSSVVEVPIVSQSVFDAVDTEPQTRSYNDVVSRVVKLYKELIDTPNPYREVYYIPRSFKDLAISKGYGDENFSLKASEASPFFTQETKYKDVNEKSYNYVNDIVRLMKDMMPSPLNFTLVQMPLGHNWPQPN